MNPYEFADKYLYPFKTKGDEIVPKLCPICEGGSHRDNGTFALNIEKLTYNCRRGSCNATGTFSQLCKEYGEESDDLKEWKTNYIPRPKVYVKPKVHAKNLNDKVYDYFAARGIGKETLTTMKVGIDSNGTIMFPYFEDGELVLVKYRTLDKKMWRTTDSKPVFWGIDRIDVDKPCWIVEGEIDQLTLIECGINNVISVPSGSNDLECISHAWDKLEQIKRFNIWNDQDKCGIEMRDELIKRLGDDRCYYVESSNKDANELLQVGGKSAVLNQMKELKRKPIENVERVAEVEEYDPNYPAIKTGIYGIDTAVSGLPLGHITIVSGKRGGGKSTVLSTFIAASISQGFGAWAFSGELQAGLFRYWCELVMAGKNNILTKQEYGESAKHYISKENKEAMRKWYYDSFFVYKSKDVVRPDVLLKSMKDTYKRYGTKLYVIDNIMMISFGNGGEKEKLDKQSNFVDDCNRFAQDYNVHVIIVQHPIKTKERITVDDIKGTGDITNRAGLTFLMHKVSDAEKEEGETADAIIEIGKNRLNGKELDIGVKFCEASKRMYGTKDDPNKEYGWEVYKPKTTTVKYYNGVEQTFENGELNPPW